MLGWMFFVTLFVYLVGFLSDMASDWHSALGWPSERFPWAFVHSMMAVCWILFLCQQFHVVKFWFQK